MQQRISSVQAQAFFQTPRLGSSAAVAGFAPVLQVFQAELRGSLTVYSTARRRAPAAHHGPGRLPEAGGGGLASAGLRREPADTTTADSTLFGEKEPPERRRFPGSSALPSSWLTLTPMAALRPVLRLSRAASPTSWPRSRPLSENVSLKASAATVASFQVRLAGKSEYRSYRGVGVTVSQESRYGAALSDGTFSQTGCCRRHSRFPTVHATQASPMHSFTGGIQTYGMQPVIGGREIEQVDGIRVGQPVFVEQMRIQMSRAELPN